VRAGAGVVAVALTAAVLALGVCGPAQARTYEVYTCVTPDGRLLGPTIDFAAWPSGWTLGYVGPFPTLRDDCPNSGGFWFRMQNQAWGAGQGLWARWSAAAGTALVGITLRWTAEMTNIPANGNGTVQLVAGTDVQVLLAQNSPGWVSATGPEPNLSTVLSPAHYFEIRFTCLDQCAAGTSMESIARVTKPWFQVDDSSPPVGGLTGSATDAQTWSGVVRFGLNAADVGAGLYRAVVEVDGSDALAMAVGDASPYCRDIGPSASVNEFAAAQPCPLRIDDGTLDVDTAKLPQGRHSVRVLLEDGAGNRTAIFGPVVRSIAATGAIGPGSDPALRGAANGDGA
jgi:hypothetical protein